MRIWNSWLTSLAKVYTVGYFDCFGYDATSSVSNRNIQNDARSVGRVRSEGVVKDVIKARVQ